MHRKILVVILVFHSMLLTYECPDLCDVDHSEGKNVKLHKMKNEGYSYTWKKSLKCFA